MGSNFSNQFKKSVFLVTNALLPYFLQQKGVIVNMASIVGLVAGGGGAAYTASKHAIIGYTKTTFLRLCQIRHSSKCDCARCHPNTHERKLIFAGEGEMATWVASETPAGRWAQPQEVAKLSLFLASDDADYIHGTVMTIDGGWTMK